MKIIDFILDWIYPPTCISCKNLLDLNNKPQRYLWLCSICEGLFEPIDENTCNICGKPTQYNICESCRSKKFYFDKNTAIYIYGDLIRDLLLSMKFRNKKHIAIGLGRLMAKQINEIPQDAVLVPLPMHKKKQSERGFNQANIMADCIGEVYNIPIEKILIRIRDTPPQHGLHPAMRIENVNNAFDIKEGFCANDKHIIIIDDIFTSGSSINECARVLKQHGAKRVDSITLCVVQNKGK